MISDKARPEEGKSDDDTMQQNSFHFEFVSPISGINILLQCSIIQSFRAFFRRLASDFGAQKRTVLS